MTWQSIYNYSVYSGLGNKRFNSRLGNIKLLPLGALGGPIHHYPWPRGTAMNICNLKLSMYHLYFRKLVFVCLC